MPEGFHHRATLKQQNKPFKSRHTTKGAQKDRAKGKVPRQSPKSTPNSSALEAQKRLNRRNAAKQVQSNKRRALIDATRIFNGVDGTPRIITVIPLTEDVSAKESVTRLVKSLGASTDDIPETGLWHLKVDRFKTSLQFILLPYGSFFSALDALKVADYTLLLLSSQVEVNGWGDTLLRTMQAQGFPSVVTAVSPSTTSMQTNSQKDQAGAIKSLLSFIQYFIPSQGRVFDLESTSSSSDAVNLMRALCEGKPTDVRWREDRPYMLVEESEWVPNSDAGESSLRLTGVIRGAPLSANRLVHLPELGDFKLSRIVAAPAIRSKRRVQEMQIEGGAVLSERNQSSADSLVSTNVPDEMNNEQTWPTEEEMRDAETLGVNGEIPEARPGTTPKVIKRVPKGTSSYQAAWIVDEEEFSDEEADEEDDENMSGVDQELANPAEDGAEPEVEEDMEEVETVSEEGKKAVHFEDLGDEEEREQLDSWRKRAREEAEDASFPDEIDTPDDIPARTRFQRYRGLRSFRTSPWDPYENLPKDYARIFRFEDYKRTEQAVIRKSLEEEAAVQPGTRVTIDILDVGRPGEGADYPSVVFGLFQHEHKISVQHYKVQRDTEYTEPVRSKDRLILCVGPRRLQVNPIYSQHTRGGGKGVNNVHKYERYLRHGLASVATIYGPICFGRQSCALLKEVRGQSAPSLVATGTFMSPDTTRIIAKRIILTGHPFKVHKRTATIRYMFFNPDDVSYFSPIQLTTKYGKAGHIRESLGTHGYFKAHFDGPISQMDTVCMSLYKRVYPKWALPWKSEADRSSDLMEEF